MPVNKTLNLIEGGNLTNGSRGTSVSQMQQILKQFGYYPGPIDGVYGPQTQQAVKTFQGDTNISQDGIFGPITQSKLLEWQSNPIKAQINDPIVKDAMSKDPNLAQSLNALQQEGGNRANMVSTAAELGKKGYYLGSGFTLDPQKMQDFYDKAKKELDPAFNEGLQFYANDFQAAIDKEKADYQDKLASAESKFTQDRRSLQNDQGQTNNVNSSRGAEARTGLVDSYNRNLAGMQRDTSYKLSDLARNYENKLGTTDVSRFQTSLPTSSVGWWSGANRGSSQAFTPMGNTRGSLNRQYESQIQNYGNKKAEEFYNPLYK
jgi:peptidoglycan hydrolase-like protein with peptidoglycan-binding domain